MLNQVPHKNVLLSTGHDSLADLTSVRFHRSELNLDLIQHPSERRSHIQAEEDIAELSFTGNLTGDRLSNQRILEVGGNSRLSPREVLNDLNKFWKRHKSWIGENPIHLSTFLQCCTRTVTDGSADLIESEPSEWMAATKQVVQLLPEFGWRELANSVHCLTKLGAMDTEALGIFEQEVFDRLRGYTTISEKPNLFDLTQIAWTLGKHKSGSRELFEQIEAFMKPIIHEADGDMASTVLQSFLWVGYTPVELTAAITESLDIPYRLYDLENTTLQLYLLGAHGQLERETVEKVAEHILPGIDSLTPNQLAMLASVCRMTDYRNEELLGRIGDQLAYDLRTISQFEDLAHTNRAFASLNYYHDGLSELLAMRAPSEVRNQPEMSRLIDAYFSLAQMNRSFANFTERSIGIFVEHFERLSERDMARVLWSSAILADDLQLDKIWQKYLDNADRLHFGGIELTQIMQAAIGRSCYVPEPVFNQVVNCHPNDFHEPKPSYFESQVKESLERLGVPYEEQFLRTGYFVDFYIEHEGRRIAFECDGDIYHYKYGNPEEGLNGKSHLKQKVLENLGYDVVRLPYSTWLEWNNVGTPSSDRNIEEIDSLLSKLLLGQSQAA